jgi:hypothetical protein
MNLQHLLNRGRELEIFLGIPRDLVKAMEDQILPLLAQRTHQNVLENPMEEEST